MRCEKRREGARETAVAHVEPRLAHVRTKVAQVRTKVLPRNQSFRSWLMCGSSQILRAPTTIHEMPSNLLVFLPGGNLRFSRKHWVNLLFAVMFDLRANNYSQEEKKKRKENTTNNYEVLLVVVGVHSCKR
jgi:hypothetical protein